MVNARVVKHELTRRQSLLTALLSALQSVPTRLLATILALDAARIRGLLLRAAAGGSVYALLVCAFGGFYEKPWQLIGVTARMSYVTCRTLGDYIARGCRPIFPEWTLGFEITRALVREAMSKYGRCMMKPRNASFIRRQSEVLGTALGYLACKQCGTRTEPFEYNGLEHVWIKSASQPPVPPRTRVVVLFFHGGGYAVLSPRMYINVGAELQSRTARLLERPDVQVDVLLANYRKIPEYPYPIPPEDAYRMYEYLIDHEKLSPKQIIIAGDSAGGGLAMATLIRARDQGTSDERLPLGGILSCPFVDLEIGGDERKAPYCLIGDAAGQAIYDLYHPRDGPPSTWGDASPVHCDLKGLPPVYIQAAELDYIYPHAVRLADKARADGVKDWELDVHANVPHVFTNFPRSMLPIAAQGLEAMAAFAASRFREALARAESA
ncbi:hypothetical protein P43SY_004656 [Pythium insidiosum]|uniref:Alpha/beta hydrolase fold-3 domain-containing protein n=1 Tax=Pythium insidiosum TaxID=114742 RepID=A0AAD5LEB2_PYTIN|nr:hypothetical protein P43SY_004656 [Pythium insidiosum]